MDLYFFIPSQLNITEKRIGIMKMISNIKVYTRFSTPAMSLKMLVDRENGLNPIRRIREFIDLPEPDLITDRDVILHELQVLTNIYRSEIDNTVELTGAEILKKNRDVLCEKRINTFLADIQHFLKEFRKLHTVFISQQVTDDQRNALSWADESVSIITERALNRLFSYAEMIKNSTGLLESIEKLAKSESGYRESMNYQYLFIEEDSYSGERMAYRENILKKWSQSALYMTKEESRTPNRLGHIVAGTAAGIAMIFAVLVTIFAGNMFIPNSTPWILLIVVSYIFKDRIKDILKDSLRRLLPRLTSDQHSILFDPSTGKKAGITRAYISFKKVSDTPGNIVQLRYLYPNPFQAILPEQDVVHYKRTIDLNSKQLSGSHSRLSSVTEIIRFQIADWLKEMDDPKDVFYRLDKGKKVKIKGNRVYKIHLILSLKDETVQGSEELYHYCAILNKAGILRIEEIS